MSETKRLNECSTEELRDELVKRLKQEDDFDGGEKCEEQDDELEPTVLYFDTDCSFLSFPVGCRESRILDSLGNLLGETPSDSLMLEVEPYDIEYIPEDGTHNRLLRKCVEAVIEAPRKWNHIFKLQLKGFNLTGSSVHFLLSNTGALSTVVFQSCTFTNLDSSSDVHISNQQMHVKTLAFRDIFLDSFYDGTIEDLFMWINEIKTLEDLEFYFRNADGQDITNKFSALLERLHSIETNFVLCMKDLSEKLHQNSSLTWIECVYDFEVDDMASLADVLENDNKMLSGVKLNAKYHGTMLPWPTYKNGDRVLYFTLLNRYGRHEILGGVVKVEGLVYYLRQIQEDDDPLLKDDEAMIASVYFGLLNMNPTLWISAVQS